MIDAAGLLCGQCWPAISVRAEPSVTSEQERFRFCVLADIGEVLHTAVENDQIVLEDTLLAGEKLVGRLLLQDAQHPILGVDDCVVADGALDRGGEGDRRSAADNVVAGDLDVLSFVVPHLGPEELEVRAAAEIDRAAARLLKEVLLEHDPLATPLELHARILGKASFAEEHAIL